MKKKCLSILVAMSMMVGLVSTMNVAVFAVETTSVCEMDGVEYETVQQAVDDVGATAKTIKMIADSTEDVTIGSNTDRTKNITLDLNGKTLKSTGTVNLVRHSAIINFATLTITDSSAEKSGTITGGTGAKKTIFSCGGGIYNYGGTLTMNGGTITGNASALGGGVCNVNYDSNIATFTMNGGTISGNTGGAGGGVYNDGTFTMNGGSITGNSGNGYSGKGQNYNGEGGGVYNSGLFNMTGGTISSNEVKDTTEGTTPNGGGVINKGTMNVSGAAKITGNNKKIGESTTTNNVYLPSGKTITVGTGSGADLKYLVNGAAIGVTTEDTPTAANPVNITDANKADYSAYFTSDNEAYDVVDDPETGEAQIVKLAKSVAQIEASGKTKKYITVQAAINAAASGQTVQMIANSTEKDVTIDEGKTVTLDLNGYELSKKDGTGNLNIITNNGSLTIIDGSTSKSGKITGISTLESNGTNDSITLIKNYAKLTIDGGTYTSKAIGGLYSSSEKDIALCVENRGDSADCIINGGSFESMATDCSAFTVNDVDGKSITIKKATVKATSDSAFAQCFTSNYDSTDLDITIDGTNFVANSKNNEADAIVVFGCKSCEISGVELNCTGNTYAYGLYNESNNVTVNSGSFTTEAAESYGIYNYGTATVLGGTYKASGTNSYGIYQDGTMTVGGSLNVSGNTTNLYLPTKKTVSVGTGDNAPVSSGDKKMKVGVTTQTAPTKGSPVAITGDNSKDYSDYFTSDNSSYKVYNTKSGEVQIVKLSVHEHTWNYGSSADTLKAWCTEEFGKTNCDYYGESNAQTVKIVAPKRTVYGDTTKSNEATLSGTTLGDMTLSANSIKYYKKDETTALASAPTAAGTYKASITIGSGTDAKTATIEYTISKKQLTISTDTGKTTTVSNKTYDGTTAATATVGTPVGVVGSDKVTVEVDSATFDNKNVGDNKTVTVAYKLTGDDSDNYIKPESDSPKAKITAKAITVTAENKSMNLGDKVPSFTAKENGLIGTDTVTYSFNTIDPKVQGVYSIVPSGDTEQGNYEVSYVQGELVVCESGNNAKADSKAVAQVLEKYRAKSEYSAKQLDVEVRTDGEVPQSDKNLIAQYVGSKKKVIFTDTDLYLVITEGGKIDEKNIGDENDTLIAVTYKFDFSKKKNIQVIRAHEKADQTTEVEELKEEPNANGEYVVYDKEAGTITVYAKKYSTYAFAYDVSKDSKSSKTSGTRTGDDNKLMTYFLLFDFMLVGIAFVMYLRYRGQKK